MYTNITVGQKYPLFEKSVEKFVGRDVGLFEAMEEGEGYHFTVFLNRPNVAEINHFSSKKIKVKLVDEQPFCLPLIRFGYSNMIFEMSFDPTLYHDNRAFQLLGVNNLLTLILVDSSTGIVKRLRSANFPLQFMETCSKRWQEAFHEENYSERYREWFRKKQSIPLERLWEQALYLGKMGERFDLEQVKKPQS